MIDDLPDTLSALLRRSVERYADRPALWVDGVTLTYAELAERATWISLQLSSTPRCAIYATRRLASYVGIFGALLAGHTYVPLSPRYPIARLQTILNEADVGTFVTDTQAAEVTTLKVPTVVMGDSHVKPQLELTAPLNNPDAYLLFTSGSTGVPKGVMVSQQNVLAYLRNAMALFAPTPDDRFTQLFDLSFDLSVHDMLLCWASGACLYSPAGLHRMAPLGFVREHQLTFWFSTPSTVAILDRLRMLEPNSLPSLRWSLFCGEAFPRSLAQSWASVAPNSTMINLYGPTETTIAITSFRLPAAASPEWSTIPEIIPIGSAFPDQQTLVMNDRGEPISDGETGELWLSGSQVTMGYWQRDDLTTDRFKTHNERWYYRTGDRVVMMADGLHFLGRLDRQIKISGHRVELQEVEIVLREATGSHNVAVLPALDRMGIPRGLIGLVDAMSFDRTTVITRCQQKLPSYMIPTQVLIVPSWPLNVNGKTDYAALSRFLERSHD